MNDTFGSVQRNALVGIAAIAWVTLMLFVIAWLAMNIVQTALGHDPSAGGFEFELGQAAASSSHANQWT